MKSRVLRLRLGYIRLRDKITMEAGPGTFTEYIPVIPYNHSFLLSYHGM